MKGYLAFDDANEGKRAGVRWCRRVGRQDYAGKRARMGGEGYVALVVDMYATVRSPTTRRRPARLPAA